MQVLFLRRVNEVRGIILGNFRGNQRENSLVGTYLHEVCLNLFKKVFWCPPFSLKNEILGSLCQNKKKKMSILGFFALAFLQKNAFLIRRIKKRKTENRKLE